MTSDLDGCVAACEAINNDGEYTRENLRNLANEIIRVLVQRAVAEVVKDLMEHDDGCGYRTNLKCDCSLR